MTEAGKQRLHLLPIFLILVSTFFLLESRLTPGWKTGMVSMPIAVNMAIIFYFDKNKLYRFICVILGLIFLFHAVNNFLAH